MANKTRHKRQVFNNNSKKGEILCSINIFFITHLKRFLPNDGIFLGRCKLNYACSYKFDCSLTNKKQKRKQSETRLEKLSQDQRIDLIVKYKM